MKADSVDDDSSAFACLVAVLRAAAPELSNDRAAEIAIRLRRDLGGRYIKKPPRQVSAPVRDRDRRA